MSDRHKRVISAIRTAFPRAEYTYCQQHIAANVQSNYGQVSRKIYNSIAYAKTEAAYKEGLDIAYKHKHPLGDYLSKIPAQRYAIHALKRPRYGQYTSNMQESVNAWWDEARKLPAATMLLELWSLLMTRIHQRREKGVNMNVLTSFARAYLTEERKAARKYTIDSSTNGKGRVRMANGAQHVVDLRASTCSCMAFQDWLIPCRHAVAICKELGEEPDDYVSNIHTADAYRKTYSASLDPIRLEDTELSDTCLAPPLRKMPGRPKAKKRIRNRRKQPSGSYKCPICKSPDHNKTICPDAPNSSDEFDDGFVSVYITDNELDELSESEAGWEGFSDQENSKGHSIEENLPNESLSDQVSDQDQSEFIDPFANLLDIRGPRENSESIHTQSDEQSDDEREEQSNNTQSEDDYEEVKRQRAAGNGDEDDDDELFKYWLQADDPEEASLKGLLTYNSGNAREYQQYMRWKATASYEEISARKASFRDRIESMLAMGASNGASEEEDRDVNNDVDSERSTVNKEDNTVPDELYASDDAANKSHPQCDPPVQKKHLIKRPVNPPAPRERLARMAKQDKNYARINSPSPPGLDDENNETMIKDPEPSKQKTPPRKRNQKRNQAEVAKGTSPIKKRTRK